MVQPEIARAIVSLDGNQAGEELKKLDLRAKELRQELTKLGANNDLAGFRQKEKELKLVNTQMKSLKNSTWDVKQVLDNLNGSSLNELLRAQRQLNAEIKSAHRNTKEEIAGYNEKIGKLKQVNAAISKVKDESQLAMRSQQSWFSSAATGMNKYFAILSAGVATLTGVVFSLKSLIQGNVELADSMADVMKTTNLTKEQVRELYSEFAAFNTRTPRKELLALAEEAGRLGMRSKKDIKDFVEVANQIKVSLGEELGGNAEEAIRDVGKLTYIFRVAQKYNVDYKQSLLMVGSAINQLATSGQVQAGFLVDISKRTAGVSSQAGIAVQDILGIGAALDELGQTAEVSSTTLNKVIVSMFKDVKTYAELANMSFDDFTNMLNTDANEALIQVLTGLNGNNAGLAVMAEKLDGLGLDGARSVQILASLAGNINLVRKYQDIANDSLVKATSLTDEYNVKNNNLAGNVDKIGRALRATFVNSSVNKAIEGIVNYFAKWVEIPVSRTMEEQSTKINMLTIELTNANTQEERRKAVWEELKSLAPEVLNGIAQESINIDLLRQNLEKYNAEAIRKIALQRASEELTKVQESLGKTTGDRAKAESDLMKELIGLKRQAEPWDQERAGWIQEMLIADGDILDKEFQINEIIKEINGNARMNVITGTNARNLAYDVRNLREEENKLLGKSNEELAKYEEMYKSIMGKAATPAGGGAVPGKPPVDDTGPTSELDKKLQELLQKQDEFRLQLIIESKSLIEQEEFAYQERLKNAGIFLKDKKDMTAQELEAQFLLEQDHNEKLKGFEDKAMSDEILRQKELFDEITVSMQIAHNNNLLAMGNDEQAKAEAEERFQLQQVERQKRHYINLLKELQAAIQGEDVFPGIDEKMLSEEGQEALKARILELMLLISELQKKIDELQEKNAPTKEEDKKSKLSKFIGDDKSGVDIFGMSMQDWEKLLNNIEQGKFGLDETLEVIKAMTNAWTMYNEILRNIEEQDLQRFQSSTDQKKQVLQNQLDQGIISQDQYHQGIAQLDNDLDNKKKQLAIKQANREKAVALVSAIVNTASAIAKALNTFPPWVGIALAALVGVMGGLQIAKIATTPIPQYASGKYPVIGKKDGKTYNAGVINSPGTGLVNSPAILAGEKPEIIIDPYTTRNLQINFPWVIDSIMAARMPQFASGKYPNTVRETVKERDFPGEFYSVLGDLKSEINELRTQLSKGIGAKLVTDQDYIEKHNEVMEDYNTLRKQVDLRS